MHATALGATALGATVPLARVRRLGRSGRSGIVVSQNFDLPSRHVNDGEIDHQRSGPCNELGRSRAGGTPSPSDFVDAKQPLVIELRERKRRRDFKRWLVSSGCRRFECDFPSIFVMHQIAPEDSVEHLQTRLPNGGRRFVLRDALDALQEFYADARFIGCSDDDDSIVAVAGRFGDGTNRRVEIGLYRSFGLAGRLEILLRYPTSLRCLLLRNVIELCDAPSNADRFFATLRSLRWVRRYATVTPMACSVSWQGEDEMAEMFLKVVPKLMEAIGPHL